MKLHRTHKILAISMALSMLLAAVILFAVPAAAAETNSCGPNATWELSDDGILTISGSGAMDDYAAESDAPWYSQRESVKAVVVSDGITVIGDRAFYNCTALTEVSIGSNVTAIGTYAFRGCTALKEITVPAGVQTLEESAFRASSKLTTITFEGDAPVLGSYVFDDCSDSLTVQHYEGKTGFGTDPWTDYTIKALHVGTWVVDVEPTCTTEGSRHIDCTYCNATFPESIPSSHSYVDGICSFCQDVEVLASGSLGAGQSWKLDAQGKLTISGSGAMLSTPWYSYRASIKTIEIGSGITSIGGSAFEDCSSLTSVTIPGSVTSIGDWAFYNCSSLTSITIPDGVTSIGNRAFYGCSSLTSITIPGSVTSIGDSAFCDCSSLASITIQDGVTSIGNSAFSNCSSLTGITIPGSVTSIGWSAFSGCSSLTGITIPGSVTSIGNSAFWGCSSLSSVTIQDGVTSIDNYAFFGCSSLSSITIPGSVTSIGDWAFCDCSSLASITIPGSVTSIGDYTFSGCSSLTGITIPGSVTSIGYQAFCDCSSLASITIPGSVTSIGDSAFWGCSSLSSVTIPDGVTSIGDSAFEGCWSLTDVYITDIAAWVNISFSTASSNPLDSNTLDKKLYLNGELITELIIPDGVTSIGYKAFYKCSSLSSITIPGSVTSIGSYAFCGCSSLTDITIQDGVTSIGDDAFSNCSSLSSITIPGSVTSIGREAFRYCISLSSITIPDSVTSIGDWAFYKCSSLSSITILGSVTSIGEGAFSGCSSLTGITIPGSVTSIGDSAFWGCSSLTGITIPGSVTSIGDSAFQGCSSLSSITVPESVTSIGDSAFCGCSSMSSITIPESVTSIGFQAFYGCSSLDSITIPESVTSIGNNAFASCSSLTSITIPGSVTSIGDDAFNGCSSLTGITIPGSVTSIGEGAFSGCSSLQDVYFGGTQEQWLQLGSYRPSAPYIHYSCITPQGHWYEVTVDATCAEDGYTEMNCDCGYSHSRVGIPATGNHTGGTATCMAKAVCSVCGKPYGEKNPQNHTGKTHVESASAETCGATGYTGDTICECGVTVAEGEPIPATGDHTDGADDGDHICDVCDAPDVTAHFGGTATCVAKAKCADCNAEYGEKNPNNHTGVNHTEGAREATCTEEGYTGDTYCECGVKVADGTVIPVTEHDYVDGKCADCGAKDPNAPALDGVIRLSGANRYLTGFAIADQLKQTLGVEKFQAVVVAYGQNFPDALTGSYLAAVKQAPILLTEPSQDNNVLSYLRENLVPGGKVYILGGTAAVSQTFEVNASNCGFEVKRLKGAGRYETNLEILKEAGVNTTDEVLIATGKNYADSLSASATGLPMLLVDKELTQSQKAFLVTTSCKFVILGGTGAVSADVEAQLDAIGEVTRVKGASRYGTSVEIAKRYFNAPSAAVLAYAQGFPDGLCGGPLALSIGAPLILTSNESSQMADDYVAGITAGVVTGGTGRISDDTVRQIFDLPGSTPIVKP